MALPQRIRIERDIPVEMSDGVRLFADRYYPVRNPKAPTILVRSPMGRRPLGDLYGQFFGRQGLQVVVQESRGASDALQLAAERRDGFDTIDWLRAQPWFDGKLALHGMSAMGFCHWALAAEVPELRAMSVHVGSSSIAGALFTGGSVALESLLIWCCNHSFASALATPTRARRAIRSGIPATDLDIATGGRTVPFYQAVVADSTAANPLHTALDHSDVHTRRGIPPVHLVAGWYDIFLTGQLADYAALRAAGGRPQLTIGPWSHYDPRVMVTANREARQWFREHLRGMDAALRDLPVRVFVTGARQWRDYADWPPPGTLTQCWYLAPAGALHPEPGAAAGTDVFHYDPADPTPAPRGPVIVGDSRPQDSRRIEQRPDVLIYTGPALADAVEVTGSVTVELYADSTHHPSDLVARLCDVHPDGRSVTVCEGIRRSEAPGANRTIIELWPVAHRFESGHRLRLQVCGAAAPRYAAHPNPATHRIHYGFQTPSTVTLPVLTTSPGTSAAPPFRCDRSD